MKRWMLVGLWGCGPAQGPSDGSPIDPSAPMLLIATAADDYSVGGLAAWDRAWEEPVDLTTLHGDSVVRVVGDQVVAINRMGMDTLRMWRGPRAGAPDEEVSVGRGSNPHDVARLGDRLLVTRYERAEAWWLDGETLAPAGTLDLSEHADADGVPEMSGVVVDGEVAWIALQRIDRQDNWTPAPEGRIVGVDSEGREVASVPVGPNPSVVPRPSGGWVATTDDGLWWGDEGEAVGPWRPEGLRGRLVSLASAGDGGWVGIAREGDRHSVVCLSALGEGVEAQSEAIEVFLSDVVVWQGQILVAARRGWSDPSIAGGLIVSDLSACGALPSPEAWIRGTLAPWSLAVWQP